MRHLYGIALGIAMALAAFFAAGWGYERLLRLPAPAGAAATSLPAGILIVVPQISPLASGLPGLFFIGWSALYLTNVQRAVDLIPLQSHPFGAGWEAMLFNGILGAAGVTMIVPLFVPSRWRRPHPEAADLVAGEAGDFLAGLQDRTEPTPPLAVGATAGRRVSSTGVGEVPPTRMTRIVTGRAMRPGMPRMPRRTDRPADS